MMSTMQRARSNKALAAPEFVDLCKTLYGELIDAQVIWDDVAKAGPDSADVHVNRGSIDKPRAAMRALAITGGVVGGGLGVREGVHGWNEAKGAMKLAHKLPDGPKELRQVANMRTDGIKTVRGALKAGSRPGIGPSKKLATAGLLGVADSVDIATLATEKTKRDPAPGQLVPVGKGVGAEVNSSAKKMKDGYLKIWNPSPAAKTSTVQAAKAPSIPLATPTKVAPVKGAAKAPAAPVAKGHLDTVWSGTFSKFDDDKHLAFGWASVVSKGGVPVIDKQGDYIAIDDIEDAAYSYVIKSRVGGDNHTRSGPEAFKASDLVESMVFTDDKVAKMGLPDDFPRGWWVGFKVHDDHVWSEVRKGNRTGFSIHGKGIRSEQSVDSIMGYAK